ncbi:bola domain-containing protein [Geopyxis carbonaria]|nr:bola domain-containing protein [Geopyxis carbonaria]
MSTSTPATSTPATSAAAAAAAPPTDAAASGVTIASLTAALQEKVGASHVELVDTSGGCGQMFEATIVSDLFVGKTTLMRHRAVNAALKAEIGAVHAWTQRCFTAAEWEKRGGKV